MKRTNFGMLVLFLAAFLTLSPSTHAQIGFDAGLSYTSLGEISGTPGEAFEQASGWHVGLSVLLGSKIGIRPGIRYMNADGLYDGLTSSEPEGFDLSYVEIPIELRAAFGNGLVKPYFLAGPVLRFPVSSAEEEFKEAVKSISYAASVGAGIEFRLLGVAVAPEINYVLGVSDFLDEEFSIGGTTFSASDGSTADSFILKLGIIL